MRIPKYILCCFYSKCGHAACGSTLFVARRPGRMRTWPGEERGSLQVLWVVLQAGDEIMERVTLVADFVDGCK